MASVSKEASAKLRHLRITAQKTRLVADMVRGMNVTEAIDLLQFTPKRSAKPIAKLIKSAAVNAENEMDLDPEALFVKRIYVDEGPTLKRWTPRAMGRATRTLKRTSHVTVIVAERL